METVWQFLKHLNIITMYSNNTSAGCIPEKIESKFLKESSYTYTHCSIIYNSQKVDTTQVFYSSSPCRSFISKLFFCNLLRSYLHMWLQCSDLLFCDSLYKIGCPRSECISRDKTNTRPGCYRRNWNTDLIWAFITQDLRAFKSYYSMSIFDDVQSFKIICFSNSISVTISVILFGALGNMPHLSTVFCHH